MRLITRVAVAVSVSTSQFLLRYSYQLITQKMKVSCVLLLISFAYVSADAPPIPYSAVASPATLTNDHLQAVSHQYVDHDGYKLQSGYEGYLIPAAEHGFFPLVDQLDIKSHGFVGKILRNLKALGWKVVPKIALGAAVLFALFLIGGCVNALICTLTPFCTISFFGLGVTKDTMRSYLTSDKIATTAGFVMDAIRKYKDMYETMTNEIETEKKL